MLIYLSNMMSHDLIGTETMLAYIINLYGTQNHAHSTNFCEL